ncbi:MAG: hypothetical protein ACK6EB_23150, partial [Planctomyces sp.]
MLLPDAQNPLILPQARVMTVCFKKSSLLFQKITKSEKAEKANFNSVFPQKIRHVPGPSQQLTNRLAVRQNPLRT